jgi:hypothetical protein
VQHPLSLVRIAYGLWSQDGIHDEHGAPMTITRDSLLTLEAYAKIRKSSKPEAIAHRKLRSVAWAST